MKTLVLGGNGFIGSHVVDRLLAEGHSVRVFDRQPERYRQPLTGVDYRMASFDDTPALAEALEGIDVVYHLISTTVPSTSNKDPVFDVESNLIGTIRLLDLMKISGVSRIVYLSSGGTVYGVPEVSPISETHSLKPICSYGVIKVAIENYLLMYQSQFGFESVILRASNPYGERQGHGGVQGVVGTFLWRIAKGEAIQVWGDGSVVRDFIHVSDLANLCAQCAETGLTGTYNVGSGEGTSIGDIVDVIGTVSGRDFCLEYKPERGFDVPHVVLDTSAIRARLSWRPEISLCTGIEGTWEWILRQVK